MMKATPKGIRLGRLALLLACVACAAVAARADVKIKSKQTMQGQTYENTTYIKGKRQRSERMGGQMITIQQCDLRRDLQLMPQAKVYTVNHYDAASGAADTSADNSAAQQQGATKGGLVTSTITTKDTGERKQMFGYTARRIITTIVTESSPDSCSPMKSKMETDGWYIDAAFVFECDMGGDYKGYVPRQRAGCQDRYQTKQVGAAKRGYPVWEKMTMYGEDGSESYSMINEVVELSQATLDAALFEAPSDYREVQDFNAAAMAAATGGDATGAAGAGGNGSSNGANSGMGTTAKSMAGAQGAQGANDVGAKKPGVARVGMVAVKTGSVGEGMSASDLASAVRNTLAEYLKSPSLELIQLEAKLPAQAEAEAAGKECDFILYVNVSHKKGGGGGFGGMFGKVVSPVVSHSGIGHTGSVAGNVAVSTIVSASSVSANVKQKDEMTLEVKLQSPGDASAESSRQFKAKAKSAGEDIITPLVEQAAQMIFDAAQQ